MPIWICKTCGAHTALSAVPPPTCSICEDERQFVPEGGQEWIAREALISTHANEWSELEPNLIAIGVSPAIGIGQRALLVLTPHGNVLWDCIPVLDGQTRSRILELGGIKAICLSHPHFYTGMVEWSEALGGVPILLPEADLAHVLRPSEHIQPWRGDRRDVLPGIVLHRLGGHFEGSSVLEWQAGADGNGALLVGDTMQVVPAKGWVSFMYSFPNLIPLPAREVRRIANRVAEIGFDRIYGAWREKFIASKAKDSVARSAERYIRLLESQP
ncbi:MBL fold metallo-hydrolase [Agrobacterium rhizogenes]|uniref:Beta-lactamase family protein n=2 Tax=Rhizobium rhizogenes TaxID=359 RepID=B9JAP5_RHIR8|nr:MULTISPECIES: MBL fold metallo-hydrolase [Rhizobium]ACM25728.1 beta-lactamase family protein [Rhizobium rhizogenes K84]KAA6483793.1 MBL fold metallo-hydrolase [Agrobacterium sp. ICMP 7243]MCJ9720907.1 MBL fold metallo-hydrolase [Agrobacterium sp. BETTINA12B]OCJ21300.1 hypothetical protein A6U88_31030 [Agrobacterium sp. B131/95]OCJ26516.1 hypothetical protein A6U89_06220 [Agrobacterium sp. B133/95]GAJ94737.1 hypothetical protein RRH01S_09_00520 [Rhizobium rhizogenes NBRC 13257]